MRFYRTQLAVIFVFVCGCSSTAILSRTSSNLTLRSVESTPLGSFKAADLDKIFGKPAYIFQTDSGTVETRIYCEDDPCQHESVIGHLSTDNGTLKSIVWIPKSKDAESSISVVLDHYKELPFVRKKLQYDYGHYFQYVDTYSNEQSGITISYDPDRKSVNQIYRAAPYTKKPAVASNGKLPIVTVLPDRDTASMPGQR